MTDRPPPPFDAIPAAWASLPPEVQAWMGCKLIEWVFADFVAGDAYAEHDKLCDQVVRDSADRRM